MTGKPKKPQKENAGERQERDFFQTPNYATDLLLPHVPKGALWSPAAGDGKIGARFTDRPVFQTDIVTGFNFLADVPDFHFDLIVENPPFSLKRKFYEKCRSYKVPFALLLPIDLCGWLLNAINEDGCQWLVPTRRIDYLTPNILQNIHEGQVFETIKPTVNGLSKKEFINQFPERWAEYLSVYSELHNYKILSDAPNWLLAKYSSAQYHSGWLTHKFNLPRQITVVELTNEQKQNI